MSNYDVIIVGAGPSGIFCAYELMHQRPGIRILLIEKGLRRLPALFDYYGVRRRGRVFGREAVPVPGCGRQPAGNFRL